jgi:hypothetical protein
MYGELALTVTSATTLVTYPCDVVAVEVIVLAGNVPVTETVYVP